MKHFSQEQLKTARKADLYDFLLRYHSSQHRIEGRSIHPINNHSLSIKRGQTGYKDFNGEETGNSVDYLVRYMGYSLDEAVFALCGESSDIQVAQPTIHILEEKLQPVFPEPASQYKQMFAYLMRRGIPADTIQMLVDSKLLYQSKAHNNCVFINRERDWAELRGTFTYGEKQFHGVVANCRHDGFWWFRTSKDADVCYVCEAAIDAISLYILHERQGRTEKAYYISIGGVWKQPAIDRVKKHFRTIMAVDNDEAGSNCRKRNSECEAIYPEHKDWNEDLQAIISHC